MESYGQISIVDLTDSYTIELSNESLLVATDKNRKIIEFFSASIKVTVYHGNEERTDFEISRFGIVSTTSGKFNIYAPYNGSISFDANEGTVLAQDDAIVQLTVKIDGYEFPKYIHVICAKQGNDGESGVSISDHEVQYGIGTSDSSYADVTWVTTKPATTSEKPYLWIRSRYVYSDNTTTNPHVTNWVYENSYTNTTVKSIIDNEAKTITDRIQATNNYIGFDENGEVSEKSLTTQISEQQITLDGITQKVGTVDISKGSLGDRIVTAESQIKQTSDAIDMMVTRTDESGGVSSEITIKPEFIKLVSDNIEITGETIFNSVQSAMEHIGMRNHIPSSRSLNSIRLDTLSYGNTDTDAADRMIAF